MRRGIASVLLLASVALASSTISLIAAPGPQSSARAGAQPRTHSAPATPAPPQATPAPPQATPPAAGEQPPFQSTLKFEPKARADGQRAAPSPVDRVGRPLLFAAPFLVDGRVGPGVAANNRMAYALPSSAPGGGVQLDVQPWRAEVYVDGTYVGAVRDFSGYYHHLEVSAGPHVIAIVAPDYEPLILDLFVSPGRVTTYHGTLSAATGR